MHKPINIVIVLLLITTLFTACNSMVKTTLTPPPIPTKPVTKKAVVLPKVCFQENNITLKSALQTAHVKIGSPIYIRIFKREKTLELWAKNGGVYTLVKTYPICRYSGYLGPKLRSGDKQSPEGIYAISRKSLNPYSKYHLALNIQYPNRYDRNHHRTGDLIMIHGGCSSTGCYAMNNLQIEEIYKMTHAALKNGSKYVYVAIYPFRLEEDQLKLYKGYHWYPFWANLKIGYDIFEQTHVPPFVGVKGAHYVFKKRGKGHFKKTTKKNIHLTNN